MSTRTVEANYLSTRDLKIIDLCIAISNETKKLISSSAQQEDYMNVWGKVHSSRDAGVGLSGKKLNRDALTTRGMSSKTLQANRNLRWTPLVFSHENSQNFSEVNDIKVNKDKVVEYKINGSYICGTDLYDLEEPFILLPEIFNTIKEKVDGFNNTDERNFWNKNRLPIPLLEWCTWQDAVEVFCCLSIIIATEMYSVDKVKIYNILGNMLSSQNIDKNENFPSDNFPKEKELILGCPICKLPLSNSLEKFRSEDRDEIFKAGFTTSKRKEGEDGATQILHINPLTNNEVNHNAKNVRFGHRWCNIAMTDHTLNDAVNFFTHISKKHR